jgi:hypothetical protein
MGTSCPSVRRVYQQRDRATIDQCSSELYVLLSNTLRTAEPIFMKFGVDVILLEVTPNSNFYYRLKYLKMNYNEKFYL